jgi:hypothetical protein
MVARDGTCTPAHETRAGDPARTADDEPFQGCGIFFEGFAPRECFAHHGSQAFLPRAQQILDGLEFMVARDGIEPPTPAFSGLRSTD